MSFREYIYSLIERKDLITITEPISKRYEIANVLKKLEPTPALFEDVSGSKYPVVGNIFCTKESFANYFGIKIQDIIPFLSNAIENPTHCELVQCAPCQEVVHSNPNLNRLPILTHFSIDGGSYITAGVVIAKHPTYRQNLDFHRCMQFSKNEMAVRVVRSRHFDYFLQDQNIMEIAVCVGNSPNTLAAAATSVEIGVNELEIANALEPLKVVKAKTVDLLIPAEAEFVLEGKVYLNNRHDEGPFVDLTETEDIVRQEPVFIIKAITHRRDAIWQALLPGGLEHKLLMGMPRESTIHKKVNEVVKCLDVNISPGGCSWLHAIVQIDKAQEDDGIKAIEATFTGHSSCKHVFVVDKDIDIYNPLEIEWAMATRFQGDKQLIVKERERGSSLDPSAEADSYKTTKMGFDLTKPLTENSNRFDKVAYPDIDIKKYIKEL